MTKVHNFIFQLSIGNVFLHVNSIPVWSLTSLIKVLIASPHTTNVNHPAYVACNRSLSYAVCRPQSRVHDDVILLLFPP